MCAQLESVTEELRLAKAKLAEEKLYLEQAIDTELGFGEIIGRSRAFKDVMEKVAKVSPSDATVLLLGETGTGKELVARAIHRLSKRKDNSFIKLNCAAIPSGLLESELFGHEKGAFTGAVAKKMGRLELADKGTLFLDEIGESFVGLAAETAAGVAGPGVRTARRHADFESEFPPGGRDESRAGG